jgi:uncharacterized protein YdeI (BOF family)
MKKIISAAAIAAALALVVPQAMAEDTNKMETGDKAAGAAADQTPGTETSDRTPEKATPTPDTQVDKTKEGDTSDRTPEKK